MASRLQTEQKELAEFIHAVRTGEEPSGEVHGNVLSLAMVEAAVLSADSGRRIVIDDVLQDARATAIADEQRPDLKAALGEIRLR